MGAEPPPIGDGDPGATSSGEDGHAVSPNPKSSFPSLSPSTFKFGNVPELHLEDFIVGREGLMGHSLFDDGPYHGELVFYERS
jgi:hypothetical protein